MERFLTGKIEVQVSGKGMVSGTCIFLRMEYLTDSSCLGYNKTRAPKRNEDRMVKTDKKLPVGVDSFEKLVRDGYYYLDKTGFICQLAERPPNPYLLAAVPDWRPLT